jgi:hypothetical protein
VQHDGTRFRLIDPAPFEDLSVTTAKIANAAVTFAKIQNITTARVLGRVTAGSGVTEEIPLGNAAAALSLGINRGTEQATTSGTAIDFTSIPAGVRRVTVVLNGVSTNGSSITQLQLGSGSIQTTGYAAAGASGADNLNPDVIQPTSGIPIMAEGLSSFLRHGAVVFHNISGNVWVASGSGGESFGGRFWTTGGNVTLSGVLDRLRLTTQNGTDAFDAGAVNIMWEF